MEKFEDYLQKYQSAMMNEVRRTGVDQAHIMDCVQEAALKLSQMHTISYVEPHRVKGLFCKVARNTALDRMRHEKKRNKTQEKFNQMIEVSKGTIKKYGEGRLARQLAVHKVLSELSDIDAEIAWQYFAQGLSLREIASNLKDEKGIEWDHNKLFRHIQTMIKRQLKTRLQNEGYP